jgi:hypothetical protein
LGEDEFERDARKPCGSPNGLALRLN